MHSLSDNELRRAAQSPPIEDVLPYERLVVEALAGLIERPDQPMSIVGCPEEARVLVFWALLLAGERALADRGGSFSWTFSTYEVTHDVIEDDRTDVVFLPQHPQHVMSAIRRTVVDADRLHDLQGPAADEARFLVAQVLHGTGADVGRQPVASGAGTRIQQREFHEVVTHPGQPDWAASAAPADGAPRFAPLSPAPPLPTTAGPGGDGARRAGAGRHDSRPAPVPEVAAPNVPEGELSTSVRKLLAAGDVAEFVQALEEVRRAYSNPRLRSRLRDELDLRTLRKVTRFIDLVAADQLADSLAECLVGHNGEDLDPSTRGASDQVRKIATLVEHTDSDRLARAVVRKLGELSSQREIAEAAAARMRHHTEPHDPGIVGWVRVRMESTRSRQIAGVAVAVAAALLLVTVYFVGRDAGTASQLASTADSTGGATPPSAQPAPTPAAPEEIGSLTIAATVPQGQAVHAALRRRDGQPLSVQKQCEVQTRNVTCPAATVPEGWEDYEYVVFQAPAGTVTEGQTLAAEPPGKCAVAHEGMTSAGAESAHARRQPVGGEHGERALG